MDKVKYPKWLIAISYALNAVCWAGRNNCTVQEIILCGATCFIMGVIMVFIEPKLPTYIARPISLFFGGALLLIVCAVLAINIGGELDRIFLSIVPPLASGALLLDGVYTYKTEQGKKTIFTALACCALLALAAFTLKRVEPILVGLL